MRCEFVKTTLGALSKNGKGEYGIGAAAVEYTPNLYRYLRITDISDFGTIQFDNLPGVNDEKADQYLLSPNDIVFARTGASTGRSYFYSGKEGPIVFAGFLIRFALDAAKVNPRFIKYYTLSNKYKGWIKSFNQGSTRGNINAKTYANMQIELPPRDVQDLLVATLSCLDDKIELNSKINANLEAQAQAIFKSWFVDFEPSQDGEFVESELGRIPKGWRVGTISNLGDVVGGSTPSKAKQEYYTENGIAWITPKDLSINRSKFISRGENDITAIGLCNSSAKLMPRGTVLFSSRAPIGYIAIASGEVCTNQGFKSVVPKDNVGTAFIYYFLIENHQNIENRASGSTFKEVSGSTMKGIPAIIPDDDTLRRFQETCTFIFKKQELLETENFCLSKIRDTLLPKLLSGELSVADFE